jgi:hypothetical protein
MSIFWSGTSCWTLLHELDPNHLKTMKDLLDIATQHTPSEEAVEAVFVQGDGKTIPDGNRGHHPKLPTKVLREAPKAAKRGKSSTPNGSQLVPAAMMMMTRKRMTLMRNMSLPPSAISKTRCGSPMIYSRNFSK